MKSKFTLHELFMYPLNYEQFLIAKHKYIECILRYPACELKHSDTIDLIRMTKRTLGQIGPYRSLTVFESLNRIASDLVLLCGTEQLFQNKVASIEPMNVCLKMGNIAGYDIVIETVSGKKIYGEAFNTAPSFCKTKMRDSISKLLKGDRKKEVLEENQAIIFCNKDVELQLTEYENQLEKELKAKQGFRLHKLFCDYEASLSNYQNNELILANDLNCN